MTTNMVMRITIMVDHDYSRLKSEEDLALNELGDFLQNEVQTHIQGMGYKCPKPRVYIMTDAESDL